VKALVVMDSSLETLELCDELTRAGLYTQHAPSGLYALTMLERERPDLIVSCEDLGDMTGHELLEIVREDGSTTDTVFVLLAKNASNLGPNDVLMPPNASNHEIIHRSELLLGLEPGAISPENLPSLLADEQPAFTPEQQARLTGEYPAPRIPELASGEFSVTGTGEVYPELSITTTQIQARTMLEIAEREAADDGFADLIDASELGTLEDEEPQLEMGTITGIRNPEPVTAKLEPALVEPAPLVPSPLESSPLESSPLESSPLESSPLESSLSVVPEMLDTTLGEFIPDEPPSIMSGPEIEMPAPPALERITASADLAISQDAFADPPVSGNFEFANRGFIRAVEMMATVAEYSRMNVKCGSETGTLYFARGRLADVEWSGLHGEDALRAAFLAASDHKGGQFALAPLSEAEGKAIKTSISKPINQILLTWSA
jgi:CheY-like chemotaxis protein